MYCSSCGNQIPDDSKFCLKCGKPQSMSSSIINSSQNVEWEYWTWDAGVPSNLYVSPVNKPSTESNNSGAMTESQVRLHFWQRVQSKILPVIQEIRDDGWEPITEVGPSALKVEVEVEAEKGIWGIVESIANSMLGWQFSGLIIKFRRQKGIGRYSVEQIPDLIKIAGY